MKNLKFIFLVVFCIQISFAQSSEDDKASRPTNNFSVNLLSEGMGLSIGYEHFFHSKKNSFITQAIGVQINLAELDPLPFVSKDNYIVNTHYSLNLGLGGERGHFEFGIGAGLGKKYYFIMLNENEWEDGTKYFTEPYALIGYRFIPLKKKKISFRISISSPFRRGVNNVLHFIGPGIGMSF